MSQEALRKISLATPNYEALNLLASSHTNALSGPPSWKRTYQNGYSRSKLGKFMGQYGKVVGLLTFLAILSLLLEVKIEVGAFKKYSQLPSSISSADGLPVAESGLEAESILEDTKWRGYAHYMKRIDSLRLEFVKESQHLKVTGRGPYGFAQFSSYRVGPKSFAAVGFGARKLRKSASESLKGCWWEGSGNATIKGATKIFYSEEKDAMAYDTIILFCFLAEDTGSRGGRGMLAIDSETIVVYREPEGREHPVAHPNLEGLPHSFTMCSAEVVRYGVEPRMISEYIEYHRQLDVKHFVMYDAGGFTEETSRNLERYLSYGTLEVVPFRGVDRFEIVEDGMLLALHDCLYRSRTSSRWILVSNWDEYLSLPPRTSLGSFMQSVGAVPWVTYGTLVWSPHHCRQGPPLFGGAHWQYNPKVPLAIERMVYHWPHVVCHGAPAGADAELCLAGVGERRYIVDPRLAYTLHMFEVGIAEEGGKHLNFSLLHHQRFPHVHLRANFTSACSSVYKPSDKIEWWVRDESQAAFTRTLRESTL